MTETLSIKVPKAQKACLKALAAQRNPSLGRLKLDALEALAAESAKVAPSSCYELTRDPSNGLTSWTPAEKATVRPVSSRFAPA